MRSRRAERVRRILLVLLPGVVAAAIVSGCTAAAPSATLTPSALPTDVSSMQVSISVAQTVPAGGSVDIPLTFEQSPIAGVTLYRRHAGNGYDRRDLAGA